MQRSRLPRSSRFVAISLGLLVALLLPATVLADAEFETSDPSDGDVVAAPFDGPIVLTFSADLSPESNADIRDGAGRVAATSDVSGPTVTLTPDAALSEGVYEVRWTSIAQDGHIVRGTFGFVVITTATSEPTAVPTVSPTADATTTESPEPSATAPTAVPEPTDEPDDPANTDSSDDVILPIVLAAVVVGAMALILMRRRSTSSPS